MRRVHEEKLTDKIVSSFIYYQFKIHFKVINLRIESIIFGYVKGNNISKKEEM